MKWENITAVQSSDRLYIKILKSLGNSELFTTDEKKVI